MSSAIINTNNLMAQLYPANTINEFTERYVNHRNLTARVGYSYIPQYRNDFEIKNISFEISDETDEFIFGEMEGLEKKIKRCKLCYKNQCGIKSECCNSNNYCLDCISRVIKNDKRKSRQPCCIYCHKQFKKITSTIPKYIYILNDWASNGYPLDSIDKY